MAARSVAVVLTLLSLAWAGCIGGGDDVKPSDVKANTTVENATCFDSCSKVVAFQETNKTMGTGLDSVNHHHDYWAGRNRVTIFETPAMMTPQQFASADTVNYKAEATFHPPQNTFVYEATEAVEFTIANPQRHACEGEFTLGGFFICHDNLNNQSSSAPALPPAPDPTGGPAGLKLRYKHASTIEWIDAGPLTWGQALKIKITDPRQTDMPHATSSAWEFQVLSPNQYDSTLEFTAKADILRGPADIPLWPGHPDFYATSDSRKILETDAIACDTNTCKLPGYEKAGPTTAQRLVSYGTKTLYVWINISEVFDPNPALAPDNWFLFHVNSTGRTNVTNVFDKTNHSAATLKHAWVLPVDDNGMDSPYADGSRWTFQLGGAFFKAGLSCYGGCADWGAKYHITVIATNHTLPLKEYDMACLGGDYCPTKENGTASQEAAPLGVDEQAGPFTVHGESRMLVAARPE
jgi:hypothetical protein